MELIKADNSSFDIVTVSLFLFFLWVSILFLFGVLWQGCEEESEELHVLLRLWHFLLSSWSNDCVLVLQLTGSEEVLISFRFRDLLEENALWFWSSNWVFVLELAESEDVHIRFRLWGLEKNVLLGAHYIPLAEVLWRISTFVVAKGRFFFFWRYIWIIFNFISYCCRLLIGQTVSTKWRNI